MELTDGEFHYCMAGRVGVDFGGRWTLPCMRWGNHALAFTFDVGTQRVPGTPIVLLCDDHMQQLIDGGFIAEVAVDRDEWERRAHD